MPIKLEIESKLIRMSIEDDLTDDEFNTFYHLFELYPNCGLEKRDGQWFITGIKLKEKSKINKEKVI